MIHFTSKTDRVGRIYTFRLNCYLRELNRSTHSVIDDSACTSSPTEILQQSFHSRIIQIRTPFITGNQQFSTNDFARGVRRADSGTCASRSAAATVLGKLRRLSKMSWERWQSGRDRGLERYPRNY